VKHKLKLLEKHLKNLEQFQLTFRCLGESFSSSDWADHRYQYEIELDWQNYIKEIFR
jgi:hypothetical protein